MTEQNLSTMQKTGLCRRLCVKICNNATWSLALDRLGWIATNRGISGTMIRSLLQKIARTRKNFQ